jgi:hypothetical protein
MIVLIDAKEAFDTILYPLRIKKKTLNKLGIEIMYINIASGCT